MQNPADKHSTSAYGQSIKKYKSPRMVYKGTRKLCVYHFFVFVNQGREIKARDRRKEYYLIIDSGRIGMESERRYTSVTTKYSRFIVKDYKGDATHGMSDTMSNLLNSGEKEELEENKKQTKEDKTAAADDAAETLRQQVESMRSGRINLRPYENTTVESFRQITVRYIFSLLFGEEKANKLWGEEYGSTTALTGGNALFSVSSLQNSSNELTLQQRSYFTEWESTSFSAKGTVKTADGREISIQLDIGMSRSFTSYFEEEMQIKKVNTCDPLVINFNGNPAEVTDQKIFFDIDGDGKKEKVSKLAEGSGYLALDKNGDGIINDGTELFGPQSGNGFADLAAYDEDGNGWIDEADSIWSRLRIWCQDGEGNGSLYKLSDKGVGAICLENAATDFTLKDADNQTNGYIRSTGIFLYENGNAGTIQHLDLAQ